MDVESRLPSAGVLTASAALLVVVFSMWRRNKEPKLANPPPSLPTLPIVGSLPFLTSLENMPMFLLEKTKKYGPVYTMSAAGKPTLVINGLEPLREALLKRSVDFAGRIQFYTDREIVNKKRQGIILRDYDETYKHNRLHSLNVMKQFGFGNRHIMADIIHRVLEKTTQEIKSHNGQPMEVENICHMLSINVVYTLIFGQTFEKGDQTAQFIMDTMIQMVDSFDPVLDMFPIFAYVPAYRKMINDLVEPTNKLMQHFTEKIRESLAAQDGESTSFVQMFRELTGDSYDEEELKFILRDLILAGSETSGVQLCWAILLLCNYPDVQRKAYEEIVSVIGPDRLPCPEDKARMPYLEATVLELMRIRPVAPLAGAHKTLCNTQLLGYDIPADTTVVINLWSAHMDPNCWEEPEKLRPERFLDKDGKVVDQDKMITFSLGKRSCLGEVLARQEIFLALATLVQKFEFLPPAGVEKLPEEMKCIRVIRPMHFKVRLVPRN